MTTWVIIPVKRLDQAKSRLRPVLPWVGDRQALARAIFEHVLAAVQRAQLVDEILVVTADETIFGSLEQERFHAIYTDLLLNPAIELGRRFALNRGAGRTLILPSDLPWLTAAVVDELLDFKEPVIIAPDEGGEGTNALCLEAGVTAFSFSFGPQSFYRHLQEGLQAGGELAVFYHANLAFDLDSPADYRQYVAGRGLLPQVEFGA